MQVMQGRPFGRLFASTMLPAVTLGFGALAGAPLPATAGDGGGSTCHLQSPGGNVSHVIYVQFDNTHFTRDNPNVPSDLEQMPHLLNFIEGNGTLLTNHHTPLISHTATDILTSLTGVYGDRMGVPVSNSFRYFNPDGTSNLGVSFAYWTDPIFDPTTSSPTDTRYNMLTASGTNAPAPWVPFTRAGCNVGAVATANTVLENIATDIPTVFGAGSVQAQEVAANPGQAFADFVGIGVHCARGSALCSSANNGSSDLLPNEPGGYSGYQALFGHKYVAPQISPGGPLVDLNGNLIQDPAGHVGFPGFDGMPASVSLAYVAALQEHGVPVTYAYISDAHDAHPSGPAYGPGQAGYVAALRANDQAFEKFFARLSADGLTTSNTLFVLTSDEGDHFVGGPPSPAGCDGVTTPCSYSQIGEVNGNLAGLLATQQSVTTPFKAHADSAPTIYIAGNPAPGNETVTRPFERAVGKLTAVNPITGNTDTLAQYLADPAEMRLLHMVTGDPARTPSLTMFADPNYFLFAGAPNCAAPCVTEVPKFAWNHGTISPDITTTWLGMVGPGVTNQGLNGDVWSDHADIRPTLLSLVGLHDDYSHQGRVLFEAMSPWAQPAGVRANPDAALEVAQAYKQIDAPLGGLSRATLVASTAALESGDSSSDGAYQQTESALIQLAQARDALATQMEAALEGAAFSNQPVSDSKAQTLIGQAQQLIDQASQLAPGP